MFFNFFASKGSKSSNGVASERTPLLSPADGLSKSKASAKLSKKISAPSSESQKLGTFTGVFVPTSLNVLSILMFLRFGFILGQSGVLGMMCMLVACYAINLVTTMSISAIASNGTVRGGGAYYLISRSLGPEFGGSIGLVLYLGFVFNTGMNAVGLVDCFSQDFGVTEGNWANWLPDEYWWRYLWASVVLVLCTGICLVGSGLFARCSNLLLVVLLVSTFSIPVSTFFVQPFKAPHLGIVYTGLSFKTFKENLMPRLSKGAAGSQLSGRETYQDLFGILFPATGGIFAGASMSGDLKNPSHSIPRGTLYGLALTFVSYTVVILAMAASISRGTFYRNANALEDVNLSGSLVLLGEVSTSLFSVLMGVIGSAKLLQALARDRLLPGLGVFGQGTQRDDEPTFAIIFTFAVAQLTMLSDINQIATFVTMTYLMTFLVTNLACFLLKISSAPNFRPSFRYFNWLTAAVGTVVSGATMFFVDGAQASGCLVILIVLFVTIHYTTAPKSWGDVSQSLIYHQVRKYLLRLSRQDHHVKYWRPQILLFVNDPRRSHKLIQFCNSLKKGALFILGHVIVASDFGAAVPEAKKQQTAWTKYIDFSKIKAFVSVAISPGIEWGTRNVVLNAGLGGMRPNIVVMGFYNLEEQRQLQPSDQPIKNKVYPRKRAGRARRNRRLSVQGELPTDLNRSEKAVSAEAYVLILEDLLLEMKLNVAIAKGFGDFEPPPLVGGKWSRVFSSLNLFSEDGNDQGSSYIDLWPIQMSAEITTEAGADNLLTTNFDTYALILQMGCILHTVPAYRLACILRVVVFVEYETDVEEERGRVKALLGNLRIEAEVIVLWLASGKLKTYEIIVNGSTSAETSDVHDDIDSALKDEQWWQDAKEMRRQGIPITTTGINTAEIPRATSTTNLQDMTSLGNGSPLQLERSETIEKIRQRMNHKSSVSNISRLGVSLSMQTHRLDPRLAESPNTAHSISDTEESSSSSDESDDGQPVPTGSEVSSRRQSDSVTAGMDSFDFESESSGSTSSPRGSVRQKAERPTHLSTLRAPSAPSPYPHRPAQSIAADLPSTTSAGIKEIAESGDKDLDQRGSLNHTPRHMETVDQAQEQVAATTITNNTISRRSEAQTIPEPHDLPPSVEAPPNHRTEPTSQLSLQLPTNPPNRPPAAPHRPSTMRHKSYPKLSSALVPRPVIATEDTAGPSIMFQTPSPPPRSNRNHPTNPLQSIYERYTKQPAATATGGITRPRSASAHSVASITAPSPASASASGYPFPAAQPLSFNNLPCRAQHLIINELMRQHSTPSHDDNNTTTAADSPGNVSVIFTTLPAPAAGTHESGEESLAYLGDLECLCQGLPPVLMVHSDSMSVTTSL